MRYEKKGQVAINGIIFLVVGVFVAITVLIFVGALGGSLYQMQEADIDAIGNNVVTNKTVLFMNRTINDLSAYSIHAGTLTVQKPGLIVQLNNFSINYDDGLITLIRNSSGANIFNNTKMNVSYTWGNAEIGGNIKTGIIGAFNAMKTSGNFTPIIVLAAVITIVLGTMLGLAGLKGGSGNGGTAL